MSLRVRCKERGSALMSQLREFERFKTKTLNLALQLMGKDLGDMPAQKNPKQAR